MIIIIFSYFKSYNCLKTNYYFIVIFTGNRIIIYELLVLDRNTWNHINEYKLLALDRNTWNHRIVYVILVFDWNTLN